MLFIGVESESCETWRCHGGVTGNFIFRSIDLNRRMLWVDEYEAKVSGWVSGLRVLLHHRLPGPWKFFFGGGSGKNPLYRKTLGLTFFLLFENTQCANKGRYVCSSILTFMCLIYAL